MHLSSSAEFEKVLESLENLSSHLHHCKDIDTILAYGVSATRELLASDRALIYQFLPTGDGVVIAESVLDGWQPILGQLIYDPCFHHGGSEPDCQCQVRAIADVEHSNLAACHITMLTQLQVKANLVSPIRVKPIGSADTEDESPLWGLLIVHQCSAPRCWQPIHERLIKQIATQLGIALHQHFLHQQLAQIQAWGDTALQRSEDHYQRAIRACAIGVWEWDLETNALYLDPLLKELLGYEDHEIRNHMDEWSQQVYTADLATVMAAVTDYLAGRSPEYSVEHRMVHKDGSLRWFLARGVALRSPDGTPYRLVGTDIDITDRKTAEIALARQTQRERAFNEVVRAVHSSLNLETVFQRSVEHISAFLEMEAAILQYLPDEGCWRHRVVYNQGSQRVEALGIDIPDAANPFADRLQQGQQVQVSNTEAIADPVNRGLARLFPGSWLLVPIRVNGSGDHSPSSSQSLSMPGQQMKRIWRSGSRINWRSPSTRPVCISSFRPLTSAMPWCCKVLARGFGTGIRCWMWIGCPIATGKS